MQQQKIFLKPEMIFKYLTKSDEHLDTLIMCSTDCKLVTTDQALYEALASVENKSKVNLSKLAKLLEVTEVVSHEDYTGKFRSILTPERAENIRKQAGK